MLNIAYLMESNTSFEQHNLSYLFRYPMHAACGGEGEGGK